MENSNSYQNARNISKKGLKDHTTEMAKLLGVTLPKDGQQIKEDRAVYNKSSLDSVLEYITNKGMRISERTLRRYHLSIINKGFIILSGVSGTGKTWLAELYAHAIGAKSLVVAVAPNWTSNEDLLGFYNPIDNEYKHTPFSQFLIEAQNEYAKALEEDRVPKPYHIILDEMNLARVEYYFAKFLSLMEIRSRNINATIDIPPNEKILLTPNLFFIGTINVDETTFGFADKVYDRAQLIEIEISREDMIEAIGNEDYRTIIIDIWDTIFEIAPFAYRVISDIKKYIEDGKKLNIDWKESLDEQILQKVLPKIKGTDMEVGTKLEELKKIFENEELTLSLAKIEEMSVRYSNYGIVTYF